MRKRRSTVRRFTTVGLIVMLAGCTGPDGGCAPTDEGASTTTTTSVPSSTTTVDPGSTTTTDPGSTTTTTDPGSTTTTDPGSTTTTTDPGTTTTTVPGDGGLVAIAQVDVQDCITPKDDNTYVSEVQIVDCDEPHEAEVYAQFTLERAELPGTGDDYPGGNELTWYAQAECQERFEGYTGHSYWTSPYDLRTITPSFSTWDVGDRIITCLIVDGDGAALTGGAGA